MKKLRVLFQGDSITDAGRDRRNYFDLGHGYASVAAPLIREAHPELDIEFINLGISGNRTGYFAAYFKETPLFVRASCYFCNYMV